MSLEEQTKHSVELEEQEKALSSHYMPVAVLIYTQEAEIQGLVYVERTTREERKLTELLNDPEKRFIAVTDATVTLRQGPSSPLDYPFLMLHVNNICMLHPVLHRQTQVTQPNKQAAQELERLKQFRNRLNAASQF
jgi:hypothetical protein